MDTIFEAAKRSCIDILQAEANEKDGVQQANQINALQFIGEHISKCTVFSKK